MKTALKILLILAAIAAVVLLMPSSYLFSGVI